MRYLFLLFLLTTVLSFKPIHNQTDPTPDEEDECPVEKIREPHDRWHQCNFVRNRTACYENEFIFSFYCVVVPAFFPHAWISNTLFFLISVYVILLMFYIIADTTDAYLIPSIIKICEYLKLPNTVAGVTLLAFGNGSADIFSILAGLITQNTSLAISAPIGAGVFVSGVCLAMVILFSRPKEKERKQLEGVEVKKPFYLFRETFRAPVKAFVRDIGFYITAITLMFIFYLLGFTNIFVGLTLIGMYITYVLTVVLGRYCYQTVYLPRKILRDKITTERKKYNEMTKNVEDALEDAIAKGEDTLSIEVSEYMKRDGDDWTGGWNIRSLAPSKTVREKVELQLKDPNYRYHKTTEEEKLILQGDKNVGDDDDTFDVSVDQFFKRKGVEPEKKNASINASGKVSISNYIDYDYFEKRDETDEKKGKTQQPLLQKETTVVDVPSEGNEDYGTYVPEEVDDSPIVNEQVSPEGSKVVDGSLYQRAMVSADIVVGEESDDDEITEIIMKKETFLQSIFSEIADQIEWSEKSWFSKLIYLIFGWYTRIIRNLIIPRSEKEEWMKGYALFSPGCGIMFCSYTFFKLIGIFDLEHWIFLVIWFSGCAILGTILGVVIFFTSERHRPPIYNPALIFLAFCSGMCFIYNAAECLVKILTLGGKLMGIDPSFLGLTILAWGNTLPDTVSNILISRKGFAQMAMGACVGEPLLNSLVGIGGLFTIMSIQNYFKYGHFCYPLAVDPSLTVSFIALIVQSWMSLIMVFVMRYRMRVIYGWILIAFYALQLYLCILLVNHLEFLPWSPFSIPDTLDISFLSLDLKLICQEFVPCRSKFKKKKTI